MAFRYACFISYRHAQFDLMKNFVEDLYEAISNELEPLTILPVYRDVLRLQGGDFYNQALARSLCESVCMVMVFTPTYFNAKNTYCTREYMAMKDLEGKRRHPSNHHGLIIPIVLRGFDQLPDEIKKQRQIIKLDQYALTEPKLSKDSRFQPEIKKVAEYIAARCRELRNLQIDCEEFQIPTHEQVEAEASALSGEVPPFPGRETKIW